MIRMGILGTGGMAGAHARAFRSIRGCKVVAACDIVPGKAAAFAEKRGIAESYTDLDEMLANAELDAVTNVTSDAAHAPTSLKLIAAGKHVLCEKPLAVNYADARKMALAAKRRGVINMVNLSYRSAAAIHKARELVQQGRLGRIIHVEASYLQGWLASKYWGDWRSAHNWLWRLSQAHGSKGVLGDIGVHILDFMSYAAGDIKTVNCRLKTFRKAKGNRIGEYRLDANDSAVITVELANGAIGTVHTTRWAVGRQNSLLLRIFGDEGALVVDLDKSYDELQACLGKGVDKSQWKTLKCRKALRNYERFIRGIKTGVNEQPDFARGAAIQKVLDACFESDQIGKAVKV